MAHRFNSLSQHGHVPEKHINDITARDTQRHLNFISDQSSTADLNRVNIVDNYETINQPSNSFSVPNASSSSNEHHHSNHNKKDPFLTSSSDITRKSLLYSVDRNSSICLHSLKYIWPPEHISGHPMDYDIQLLDESLERLSTAPLIVPVWASELNRDDLEALMSLLLSAPELKNIRIEE